MFNLKALSVGTAALTLMASAAFAETTIRIQSCLETQLTKSTCCKALQMMWKT